MNKLLLLITIFIFISCGFPTPTYHNDNPLIITEAVKKNNDIVAYTILDNSGFTHIIYDKVGKYQIGDTVLIIKK